MTEAEDASVVWRCREEIKRLMPAIKTLEKEMAEAVERLKAKTGTRQAGNFRVIVESKTREGYAVAPGAVVTLKVDFAPGNLEVVF